MCIALLEPGINFTAFEKGEEINDNCRVKEFGPTSGVK